METAQLRKHALALCLIAPAAAGVVVASLPAVATAQTRAAAPAPEIYALQLNADSGVASGSQLQFTVEGTPRSQVRVAIADNAIRIGLKETARGVYRGTYTVRRADNIDPTGVIRVSLTSGRRTAVMNYTYPPSFIAAANPPPVAQAPAPPLQIERFTAVAVDRIEPGTVLQYRLIGAPGAQASFSIPGLVDRVEMREIRPGRYEGSYTVRRNDDIERFDSAVATLRAGNRVVTADLDRLRVRDNDAPVIADMTPRQGASVPQGGAVTIGGRFQDAGGRGVEPRSVRIVVSGRDVTNESRITPDEFSFRGPLPPGRHTVEVMAQDPAGNSTAKSWTFEVGSAPVAAPHVPLQFLSPSNNAAIDGGQVTVQGRASPGALVRIKVDAVSPAQGGRMAVAQPVLSQTVQADMNGIFSFNFGQPRVMPPPGTRYEVSAESVHGGQTSASRMVLFQRG